MNGRTEAQRHLATIRDPIGLAHDAIAGRHVADRDDAVGFLLEQLVQLAYRYEPARDRRGPDFGGYAAHVLKLRVVDYIRRTEGRAVWKFSTHTYRRELPVVLSLDQDSDETRAELVVPVAAGGGDPAADSDPTFARLVAGRDRRRAGDLATLGISPAA